MPRIAACSIDLLIRSRKNTLSPQPANMGDTGRTDADAWEIQLGRTDADAWETKGGRIPMHGRHRDDECRCMGDTGRTNADAWEIQGGRMPMP